MKKNQDPKSRFLILMIFSVLAGSDREGRGPAHRKKVAHREELYHTFKMRYFFCVSDTSNHLIEGSQNKKNARKNQRALHKMRRTTRMVNGKPPKNIGAKTSSFLLRKKFWICDNRTTQLRASLYQNPSLYWGGSPLAIYFRLGKS